MRRRFGRGRRGRKTGEGRHAPIDAGAVFARIVETGAVRAEALEPVEEPGIPLHFAALATGTATGEGETPRLAVGFAPLSGGDAVLATLALAQRLRDEEQFAGEAIAVAPQWSISARRRLSLLGETPYGFRAVVASGLAAGDSTVELEPGAEPPVVLPHQVGAQLESAEQRDLFARALAAFEGLAAKHGGSVRGFGNSVELCLLARCVAALRVEDSDLVLATLAPERSTAKLDPSGLATAMDRLEGALRKRLADRRVRSSDEGLRAQLAPRLVAAAGLRRALLWPLGGSDHEALDLTGIDGAGRPVVGAIRGTLTLTDLGAILDATLALRPALPLLLGEAAMSPGLASPRLLLAAGEFEEAVVRVLPVLAVERTLFDVRSRRGSEPELESREGDASAVASSPAESGPRRSSRRGRSRGRSGGRGPRSRAASDSELPAAASEAPPAEAPESQPRRFDEISLFDLDDDRTDAPRSQGEGARRRGRGRGRRRGRRSGGSGSGSGEETAGDQPAHEAADRDDPEPRPARLDPKPESDDSDLVDADGIDDLLAPLATEVPEVSEMEEALAPAYDDDEPSEQGDEEQERARVQREARRRAREAAAKPPEPEGPARPPRRRAVFVAHADRDSVAATVLLARDHRLVEGFWVYPQADLMTFFRSVATDLRDDTPIFLVGFRASPAHDALQAASLYRDRLSWFDHHDWPPEDLEGLRQAIGPDFVHVYPGAGSSLPAVLETRTRRSRFSDKLVDLVTGRFTEHDFERWGRLWWQRLADLAGEHGELRARLDPLLTGRPSDLADEAAAAPMPPVPEEVTYVSHRDFRLVYFGGYTLVVVPTPRAIDPHLTARVARERYGASLSLSRVEGEEVVMLGTDETRGRRSLDVGAMVDHLVAKHAWIEALPDADHVARMRVRDLLGNEERLDEVIREVAMGRSILEG